MDAFERVYGEDEGEGPWVDRVPRTWWTGLLELKPEQDSRLWLARAWTSTESMPRHHRGPRPDPVSSCSSSGSYTVMVPLCAQRRHEAETFRGVEEALTLIVRLVQRAKQQEKGVYLWYST